MIEGVVVGATGAREVERKTTTFIDSDTKTFMVEKRAEDANDFILSDKGICRRRLPAFTGNVPEFGNPALKFIGLQRGHGTARLIAKNESQSAVDAAAGVVVLGPIWALQFGDSTRL